LIATLRPPRSLRVPIGVMVVLVSIAGGCALWAGVTDLNAPVKGFLAIAFALAAGALIYWRPVLFPFAAYLFMVPFDNLLQTGAGTITKFLGMGSAIVVLLVLTDRRRAMTPPLAIFMWAAFLVWNVASYMWSEDPWFRTDMITQTAELFVLATIFSLLRVRFDELKILATAVVAGGTACAIYGVWLFTHGTNIAKDSALSTRLAIKFGANGPYINADHFSAALVFPIALAMVGALHLPGWKRFLAIGALLVMLTGIYVSATRGSLVAVGAMCLYLLFTYRYRIRVLIVVGLGLLASAPFPSMWMRFFDPSQGNAGGRFPIWQIAWRAFTMHPIGGIGTGQFKIAYEEAYLSVPPSIYSHRWMEDPHNLIASTAVELGIVGLLLILAAWWVQLRVGRCIPRSSRLFDLRIAVEAGTVGLFVNAMAVDLMFYKYLWITFMMAILVRNAWLSAAVPAAAADTPGVAAAPRGWSATPLGRRPVRVYASP
jgi:O-antigen ligase